MLYSVPHTPPPKGGLASEQVLKLVTQQSEKIEKVATRIESLEAKFLLFQQRMVSIVEAAGRDPSAAPLFLHYGSKLAHYPLQAPPQFEQPFRAIEDDNRRLYLAMVAMLDQHPRHSLCAARQASAP